MRPYGKPKVLEKRRLRAIRLIESGQPYRAVAAKLHASLSSVVRWQQAYRKDGRGGLRPKQQPGRPCALKPSQKKKLLNILTEGAMKAGHQTDLWTLKRIGQIVRKSFGIRYSTSNLWYLMNSLDWSCQKPTKKAKERREAEILYWKEHVWPHIKKGRRAWSPFGFFG